ncbi:molybdenum cofactor guanylyltransferase [Microdochium nivale]|nr:molybdenum cofactor guanylyltransferase [Microdochium nivale]
MATPPPPQPPSPAADPVPTAALILAGGPSSRMGYPKHLLKLPHGHPLYLSIADTVHRACPHLDRVYISLAEGSYLDEGLHAKLSTHSARSSARPPITTVNADNTPADSAVIGLKTSETSQLPPLELGIIWDKKTPILYPPPTRAQQRREEKKRSKERPEKKSTHTNRSTSSTSRRGSSRTSDASHTAPATPHGQDSSGVLSSPSRQHSIEADGDIDALGGIAGSANAGEGPIRGFLAAHEALPDATWLVIACDYPRLTVDAIRYLIDAYEPPVTCYRGARAKWEPLISIWSPEALVRLKQNCDPVSAETSGAPGTGSPVTSAGVKLNAMDLSGDVPPLSVAAANTTLGILGTIRQLNGKAVEVPPEGVDDIWMYNVNTPGNWDTALELYDI